MREQATRTERRSRKGIACAAVLACVLGAGCLAWGCTPAAAPSDGADKTARFHDNSRAGSGDK